MCSVGDNVIDRYLSNGAKFPGGGAVNVAVHARRSGIRAGYVGTVGDDLEGKLVLEALRSEGVDVSRTRRVPGATAMTDISISSVGERTFVAHHASDAAPRLDAQDLRYLAGANWIYSNYSSQSEQVVPTLASVAPLVFDFSYKGEDYASALLPHITVAAFSRSSLNTEGCVELIRRIQAQGPRVVVVTRGAKGASIGVDGNVVHEAAQAVVAVDTLGAGDAFLARFTCGLFADEPLVESAQAATVAAAEVCTHHGGFGHEYALSTEGQEA
jgi:fructoselysine 6-kinase